jgi:hypothetical protein
VKAASQDIATCKSSPLKVRAQIVAEMARKLMKGTAKIKRAGDAQKATDGIVTDAAKDAASKRSRSSASTGDIKGLYPGTATNEQNLSMAIADFIHSEDLPEGVAVKTKFIKILALAKHVGAGYTPSGREQVGGHLLDSLSSQYDKHALRQLFDYKEEYGPGGASDGATIHHVCSIAVILEVVD